MFSRIGGRGIRQTFPDPRRSLVAVQRRRKTMSGFNYGQDVNGSGGFTRLPIFNPTSVTFGDNPFALATIFLDTGIEREAEFLVRQRGYKFKGRISRFNSFDRALSGPPPTLPIIGGAEFDLSDTDGYWRTLFNTTTQRRRFANINIGFEGGSESQFPMIYRGELDKAKFPPGIARLSVVDVWKRWMTREIPPWINRLNFPHLPEGTESGFFPMVFGRVVDESTNPQGAIELPLVDENLARYAANRTQTKQIVNVWRKLPTADLFTIVSASEYTKEEVTTTIDAYPGYILTYVRFNSQQPDGTIIRADIDGTSFRGQFNNMPGIANASIRNPVDHLINILYFLFILEGSTAQFDQWAFYTTWQKYDTLALYSDGPVTENMTFGELISQICYSAMMDIYPNKFGLIAVNFNPIGDVDAGRPVYDDAFDILRAGSLKGDESELRIEIDDVDRTINQFEYYYGWLPGIQQWGKGDFYNNTADQNELGEIEHDIFYFYFVRDTTTMNYIIALLASAFTLRTKKVTFFLSGPRVAASIELAQLIGLTYYGGYGGPWVNQQVKVFGLRYDGQRHEMEVTAYTLVALPVVVPACPGITGPIVLHLNELEVVDNVTNSRPYSGIYFDPANYPGLSSVRIRFTLVKRGSFSVAPSVRIVDETGTVYLTPALSYDANNEAHVDAVLPVSLGTAHTYYIECTKTGSGAFQIATPRLWVFLTDSDEAMFQIPVFVSESFVVDSGGLIFQTNTPSLAYRPFYGFPQVAFTWDAEPYGWGDVDYLQTYIVADPFTDTGLIALFDKTTDTMVAGTEFTVAVGDSVNAVVYTLQFSPSLLTLGHTYEFRGKSAALYIINGSLFIKVGSSTLSACRGEVYVRTSVFDCETFFMSRAYQHNAADWPATAVFYFDVTGDYFFAFAGETVNLVDTGTTASPISPPTVIASVTLGASWDHGRTGPITLTDGHFYSVTSNASTTPTNDRGAYIVAMLPEP